MKELLALMKKKAQNGQMGDREAEARMAVLEELKQHMHEAMSQDLPGRGKMEAHVAADNPEDLLAGLDKAKEAAGSIPGIALKSKQDSEELEGEDADHNLEPDVNEEGDEDMMDQAKAKALSRFAKEEDSEPAEEEENEDESMASEKKEPLHKKSLRKLNF